VAGMPVALLPSVRAIEAVRGGLAGGGLSSTERGRLGDGCPGRGFAAGADAG